MEKNTLIMAEITNADREVAVMEVDNIGTE